MAVPSRTEVDVLVAERLAADPTFRERLVADPRAGLAEVTGMDIPDAVSVTLHQESLTEIHLVLPAEAGAELGDGDLELVAGGSTCWFDYCQE